MITFDIIFSNPPYGNIDLKILTSIHCTGTQFIIVHPATWVMDMKNTFDIYQEYKELIDGHVKSLEFFNGNPIFGIESFVPVVITHVDKNYTGSIDIKYFYNKFKCESIFDVTKFCEHWLPIVKPFKEKIDLYLENNSGVWAKRFRGDILPDSSKYRCQLSDIRGTPYRGTNFMIMHLNDFYTLANKISDNEVRKSDIKNTYYFDSECERNNFFNYCKTYFARFCIAIYKNNSHLDSGEMKFLPYLNFKESWDDEKLFTHFDIDKQTQEYITTYLPKFYD